jgi:phosphatidylserine/phosphatidylglycerophosphate/cardiolipin synthase-like enzyme
LLEATGIPVWIDYEPAIAHNKVIIIDGRLVIGGSYNYTAAAQKRNAENVTFMESEELAQSMRRTGIAG